MGLINYTPQFLIAGNDDLNKLTEHLVLIDSPGLVADTLTLTVNMKNIPRSQWPRSGDELHLKLGWKESGLVDMGKFTVSKVKPVYLPKKAIIIASPAPFNAQAGGKKVRRSETYTDCTLGDLVRYCANRLGLSSRVHPDFENKQITHIDQKNESDLAFLSRLALRHDAVAKPINGLLVFSKRGQSRSLSGQSLQPIPLQLYEGKKSPHNAFKSVSFVEPEREIYRGVIADWYNQDQAEIVKFQVGQSPFKQLPGRFADEQKAKDAAIGELSNMARNGIKASYTVAGEPMLMSEAPVNFTGFDEDQLNGDYSNDRVEHVMTPGSSYVVNAQCSAML